MKAKINEQYCELREKVITTYQKKKFLGLEWWVQVSLEKLNETELFIAWEDKENLPKKVTVNGHIYYKYDNL